MQVLILIFDFSPSPTVEGSSFKERVSRVDNIEDEDDDVVKMMMMKQS